MKCIIIDDEPKAISILERYVDKVPYLRNVKSFRDSRSAYDYLKEVEVDLIFLDINMPGLSGIQLMKMLKDNPMVIFSTAYSEYAIDGFDMDAVDYLLKPVEFDRFLRAVDKAHDKLLQQKRNESNGKLFASFLLLKSGNLFHKVEKTEILYLKKDGNYVEVFTTRKKILIRINMNEIFNLFPEEKFVRVHKSFVVSLLHVEVVEAHQVTIAGQKIPIGSKFRDNLLYKLNT